MKKMTIAKGLTIAVLIIVLVFVVLLILDNTVFKRTPESVLKVTFSISLKGFDYRVETFEEQWCPNGDVISHTVFNFNELTKENIDYLKSFGLKPLPISEKERKIIGEVPKEFLEADTGYYIYEPLSEYDTRDYKVFIVDTERKIAVLYYQIM